MLKDLGLLKLSEVTTEDLIANQACIKNGYELKLNKVNVCTWFLPIVTHCLKGGVRTVFMFAEKMSIDWGTLNIFVIYSHNGKDFDTKSLISSLTENFPNLRFLVFKFVRGTHNVSDLPRSEIAFCTLWTTAYLLLKYNQVIKKFYFMQDYEPLFYEAGSVYAAIEQTYRFGFSCIANTPGVGNKHLTYSNDMAYFYPGVDRQVFHPRKENSVNKVSRVVFYGRPDNPRNCFSLGITILKALKEKMGNRVEIISVGAEWKESQYGVEGVVKNLGLLSSLQDVADLYRSADIGLVFMVTPHPSYQPLEYMACGCIVATNINESNSWLLNDTNALLIEPNSEIAAERISKLLEDKNRQNSYREEGYKTIAKFNWDNAYDVFKNRLLVAKMD